MISFLKDVWVVCLEATSEANDFQFVFILFSDFLLPRSFDGGSFKDVVFFFSLIFSTMASCVSNKCFQSTAF